MMVATEDAIQMNSLRFSNIPPLLLDTFLTISHFFTLSTSFTKYSPRLGADSTPH